VHQVYLTEREIDRSRSSLFPIVDCLIRSGDIRHQSQGDLGRGAKRPCPPLKMPVALFCPAYAMNYKYVQ